MNANRPSLLLRRTLFIWPGALFALALAGCAVMPGSDPLRVTVVGVEALQGEGLELRFAVKLRVLNPNDTAIEYDGVALDLELNGKALASGASNQKGVVPRFGEAVFSVPVSISAFGAFRQAMGLADGQNLDKLPYALRGKLAGGPFGTMRFTDQGVLNWPQGGRLGG